MESLPSNQSPEHTSVQTEASLVSEQELAQAQHGVEKAGETIERMDHKDELYAHLGFTALGIKITADSTVPKPRTWVERMVDRRLEKKSYKREYKEAERAYHISSLGEKGARHGYVVAPVSGFRSKREATKEYKAGRMTAAELREAKARLDAGPTFSRTGNQVRVDQKNRISRSKYDVVDRVKDTEEKKQQTLRVMQPVSSRWRSKRREWAQNKRQRNLEVIRRHQEQQDPDSESED